MNPDGYEFSHTSNNLWRKSRKPNTGSACIGLTAYCSLAGCSLASTPHPDLLTFCSRGDCTGTDLNRNYGDHWCESGASKDACSDTFCGAAAFDNVETASVKKFAAAEVASGGRILVETDVHAYGCECRPLWASSVVGAGACTRDWCVCMRACHCMVVAVWLRVRTRVFGGAGQGVSWKSFF